MTANDFRRLVLALPETQEGSHMGHADFRAGGKVIASLGAPSDEWGMVKLPREQQAAFVKLSGGAFVPANGAWGRAGCTMIHLPAAKKAIVREALVLAHEAVIQNVVTKKTGAAGKAAKDSRRPNAAALAKRKQKTIALVESLADAAAKPVGDGHFSLEASGKRFGYLHDNHHGDERLELVCKAAPGVQATLTKHAPDRYHIPSYVGRHGWIGFWLDLAEIDWKEVKTVLSEAHELIAAPKRKNVK